MKINYCKRCIMPDSRPRIVFDASGVCNACNYSDVKSKIDWSSRRSEFEQILDQHRSKNGEWDCVVPWSGGKDSSSIAYKLKFEFGMNPLLVTFSPLIPNEVGMYNRESLIRKGFDNFVIRPNQDVSRHLAKRFFIERGNQKVCWDAGVNVAPLQVAVSHRIKLVFYAEHGESEYGGKVRNADSSKIRDFTEVIEHQVGDDPRNWADDKVKIGDLNPYIYPDLAEVQKVGVKAYYFAYFFRWSMLENYLYLKDKIDFKVCPEGRTEGTFTNFDSLDDKTDCLYYYMQYVKFGFGRATRDACRMVQNNQMSREEALDMARKYDAEFPARFHADNLNYLGLTDTEFRSIVDKHRNSEIWKKDGENWKLVSPPN